LYDENISNRKFEIKVGEKMYHISENSLKQAGINTAPESIKSLINVSEEIAKFRSVRNLNENAQITIQTDKILKDLDADVLYDAIINDKIDNIRAKNDAQKYLTLTWCFTPSVKILFKSLRVSAIKCLPYSLKELVLLLKGWNNNATKHRWLYLHSS
jgi:hypothetical protein